MQHTVLVSVFILATAQAVLSAGSLPQGGLKPAQDFLFDLCAPPEELGQQQQKSLWPVHVDDICTSFGLNDPANAAQACEVVSLLKMLLANPAAAPLHCEPDAIAPPPGTDPQGACVCFGGVCLCRLRKAGSPAASCGHWPL